LFCRFQIDYKLELRWLLHRQISRFGAFQDLVHVVSGSAEQVIEVRSIRHEAALIDKLLLKINSGQTVPAGKLDNAFSFAEEVASLDGHYGIDLRLLCGLKRVL